mmetsp:Transcript_10894/g.8102  ORF Transcript_10894/g.8102 Transcript_10894/m.8102 type:complete len:80 (+) Transcript_10894:1610-1849(+)
MLIDTLDKVLDDMAYTSTFTRKDHASFLLPFLSLALLKYAYSLNALLQTHTSSTPSSGKEEESLAAFSLEQHRTFAGFI